jgi:hypothetical protein
MRNFRLHEDEQRMVMAGDIKAQIQTHQDSIRRYRKLLSTKLTDQERDFIERRLAEEQVEIENLAAHATES